MNTRPPFPNHVLAALAATLLFGFSAAAGESAAVLEKLKASPASARLAAGATADAASVKIERDWDGPVCRARVRNTGATTLKLSRVDLFDFNPGLPGDTPIYGECFQMLGQLGGTLAKPEDWGTYPDRTHYKLAEPDGLRTAHGMLLLHPATGGHWLLGFTSCRRFDGRISFSAERILVSLDTEGLTLAPGAAWELEDFLVVSGLEREALLDDLCARIERNHPRRTGFRAPPMGWCSWYCFGPKVTATNIFSNLDWIARHTPQLRYIQIDDGYQPWMGDWLETGKSFGGDIKAVLKEIRRRGFEPAIWVAPFVASPQSKLFQEHPEWFMKGEDGQPLRSDKVGFGGWRLGPWYALDGTHPEAQKFLEDLFRTLRQEWGCTYFKLDANYWGTLHQARLHDPNATRIEAYRRGMAAILRGSGDAFILGCNHPMWPSLGLIDGSRSSMDISRNWNSIRDIGRENLRRGWQNGRFWWNDPDCVLLAGGPVLDVNGNTVGHKGLPESEVVFHATTIHASGGMLLSGDNLPALTPPRLEMLRKLLPPTGRAARFADESLTVGRTPLGDREFIYLFNWSDAPAERVVRFARPVRLRDYWTGEDLGRQQGEWRVPALPARTARLIEARRATAP
jgi:alpha-galactosidase